ncbi:GAF and ANTAR domain-containing protein [Streptomyces sp. NPDC004561]
MCGSWPSPTTRRPSSNSSSCRPTKGPAWTATAKAVASTHPNLEARTDRWPQVAPFARQRGYRAAHALPLRAGHQTIGAVNLLLHTPGGLPDLDLNLAQALADVTAIALVSWVPDPLRPSDISTSVQATVAAKASVDIATGMLAEHGDLTLAQARTALRAYANRTGRRLTDIARALTSRMLPADDVLTTHHTTP